MKYFNRKLLLRASAFFLLITPPYTYSAVIEEVIVTVQKREQTMQEIPVAISAFDGDMMVQMGINDVRDLVDLTPGFSGKTEDSFIDALSIRGIVTNDFGIGGDPSIAVFTDGVWAGRNGGVQMSFYDMWRAEVVRGPQSTLFGRNAIAGGINIVTNEPNENNEGSLSATIAEYSDYEFTGTINIPLTDIWYFRGSAYFRDADGWLENVAGGDDLGRSEITSTRLALRYAGDEVDAIFRFSYEDREQDPSLYWTENSGVSENKVNSDLKDTGFDKSEIFLIQANITWEISDDYSLESITAYKTYDFNYFEDFDGSNQAINIYSQDQEVDYISQEVRLNYEGEDNITWFVGASAYQEDIDAQFSSSYNEDHLCTAIIDTDDVGGATGCDDPIFEAYWGDLIDPADILAYKSETNINELNAFGWAIYGDINWQVTEKLGLTVGGRYTVDEKEMAISVLDGGGALGNTFSFEFYTNGFVKAEDDWSDFTPRIAINYDANEEVSVYASVAKGYKTGGYSTFGVKNDGATAPEGYLVGGEPLAFDPEETTSFEVGSKMILLDGSLQLNATYFSYVYTDLQLVIFESGSSLVKNLGEAENQGIEIDAHWTPGERWDLRAGFAWQDTEITEEIEAGDGSKGNQLPFAPEISGSLIGTYTYPIETGSAFFTAQYVYQDETFGGTDNIEFAKVDSWKQVDIRGGYRSDNNWSLTLWVDNVFDDEYFERGWENAGADNTGGFGLVNALVWTSKPQTVGLTYDKRF